MVVVAFSLHTPIASMIVCQEYVTVTVQIQVRRAAQVTLDAKITGACVAQVATNDIGVTAFAASLNSTTVVLV